MATYVISDIHGEYDKFITLLEKIDLKDSDTLYILGDVVDRGPNPVKTLLKLMEYVEDRYKAEKDYIKAAELFLRIMGYCWM